MDSNHQRTSRNNGDSQSSPWSRRQYLGAAAATATVGLAGCMGGDETDFITVGTGSTGGVYYPLGGGMADLIEQHVEGVSATAEATGGSVANVRLVADEEMEVAMAFGNVALDAESGTGEFDSPQPVKAAFGMYFSHTHVVVPADSDVETLADLEGASVGVGAPGSGTETVARELLEWYELTYDDINENRLDFSETADAMRDEQLDAGFWNAAIPVSSIENLATQRDIRILDFPESDMNEIDAEFPYFGNAVLPGGTYPGVDDDVLNPGISNIVFVHEDEDEERVYDIVAAIFDNIDDMINVHPAAEEFEGAASQAPIEFHPGAEAYLNDAGL